MDASKVHTIEDRYRDLKIAVVQESPAGAAASSERRESRALPRATARLMWADIAKSKEFRKHWRPRLRRLRLKDVAELHMLGDDASWIWKSADRTPTGCRQTLDIFHACEHIADAGKKLFGEQTPGAEAFFGRGRELLLAEGWDGICRLLREQYAREDMLATRAVLEAMTGYFAAHLPRLNCGGCRSGGRPIGNGAVEGAAKTLGQRLKTRGAR